MRRLVRSLVNRAQNTDDPARLRAILDGLAIIARDLPIVLPLHPRTRNVLGEVPSAEGLTVIEPVGYLDMLMLERNARLVITDSGGVQKEAFFYEVPCLTLREETEWTEL